ncbi:hypothetical protein SPHFLASMR4Y_00598 [Sphingorhabdus sp. SMR4y]|nr:hypothetical protein SPHFLASMR4Y_00598 [Sphingorhabdus sp. SMR4y]
MKANRLGSASFINFTESIKFQTPKLTMAIITTKDTG